MSKYCAILAIVIIIAVCCSADQMEVSRKKHKHHYMHHLKHYWIFLAIKAKIIFLIGTFISLWVFAGKAFAFLYYIKNKDPPTCNCPPCHHVVSDEAPPHFDHRYSTIFHSEPSSPPVSSQYKRYSRSFEDSIFSHRELFKNIINRADVTDLAFSAMKVKEKSCRQRFVCEADHEARYNSLLSFILYIFSDVGFSKYRTNQTILSIEDCKTFGQHCNI